MTDLMELFRHWHAGRSQVQISQALGIDRKMIRKYLCPTEVSVSSPFPKTGTRAQESFGARPECGRGRGGGFAADESDERWGGEGGPVGIFPIPGVGWAYG